LILKGIVIGGDNANSIIPEEITITGASGTSGAGNLTGATRGVNADGTIGAGYAWPSGTNIAATFSTGIYNQIKDNFDAILPGGNAWAAWTPTLTWTAGTPSPLTVTARWMQVGKIVYYTLDIRTTDGNGATALKVTLPVTPATISGFYPTQIGYEYVDGVITNPWAYIDHNVPSNGLNFVALSALTDTKTSAIRISGFYEVA
jgi:hypothetical protein